MKIATTQDKTVWECDAGCGVLAESSNAFTLPPGWWVAVIERRTAEAGKLKRGSIEVCSKDCLLDAIKYQNQELVGYVDG